MNMNQNPPENLVKMQRARPCPRVSDSAGLGRGLEMFHSNVFPGDAAGPGSNSEKCQMNQSFSVVPWNAAICVQLFRSKDRLLFQMEPALEKKRETRDEGRKILFLEVRASVSSMAELL